MNLNMPMTLPRRRNPFRDFVGDSPITEIGASQARLTGEALAANDSLAQYCYSSPSLRCIQTAHYILQGLRTFSFESSQELFIFRHGHRRSGEDSC